MKKKDKAVEDWVSTLTFAINVQEWLRAVAAIFVLRSELANLTSPEQPTPVYTALSIFN